MDKQSHFGENLRKIRLSTQLTQKEVADGMGLSRACIANYERSSREPSLERLQNFSNYFHVSVDELLQAPEKPSALSGEGDITTSSSNSSEAAHPNEDVD